MPFVPPQPSCLCFGQSSSVLFYAPRCYLPTGTLLGSKAVVLISRAQARTGRWELHSAHCVRPAPVIAGRTMVPQRYTHALIPGICECVNMALFGKRVFAAVIKNL